MQKPQSAQPLGQFLTQEQVATMLLNYATNSPDKITGFILLLKEENGTNVVVNLNRPGILACIDALSHYSEQLIKQTQGGAKS